MMIKIVNKKFNNFFKKSKQIGKYKNLMISRTFKSKISLK